MKAHEEVEAHPHKFVI